MTNLINNTYSFFQWYARYGHDHLVEIISCLVLLAIAFVDDCRAAYFTLRPKFIAILHTVADFSLTVLSLYNYITQLYSERVVSTPALVRNYLWLNSNFWQ